MVDDLGVGSNETELDRIFEEKLYVNKRSPLTERNTDAVGGNGTQFCKKENALTEKKKEIQVAGVQEDTSKPNDSGHAFRSSLLDRAEEDGRLAGGHTGVLPFLREEDALGLSYARDADMFRKETSLDGIYCSRESDVHKNQSFLIGDDKRITFGNDLAEVSNKNHMSNAVSHVDRPATSDKTENHMSNAVSHVDRPATSDKTENHMSNAVSHVDDCVLNEESAYKEKVKRLEIEFNKMARAHRDTIKMKSKLYKFIYNEIAAVQDGLVDRITLLERENDCLRQELSHAKKRMESYRAYSKVYHRMLLEKICAWKKSLEKQVGEYLSRRAR